MLAVYSKSVLFFSFLFFFAFVWIRAEMVNKASIDVYIKNCIHPIESTLVYCACVS